MRPEGAAFTLTLSCQDRTGIVADVAGHLARIDGFILDSQQYADVETGRFFMRVEFAPSGSAFPTHLAALQESFHPIARRHAMEWRLLPTSHRPRLVIAVSRASHCLVDLLHRWQTGSLPVVVAAVVSNHDDLRLLTEWYGIAFHHLPVVAAGRGGQEAELMQIVHGAGADLLILARYMQILSSGLATELAGRCINIHHSFLPSFVGAHPYRRAHARGVKLIGATAHFVTPELDEGPIIEQDVERVDHRATEAELIRLGRDIEARVLARAVHWTAERRVFLNGRRTVVFN